MSALAIAAPSLPSCLPAPSCPHGRKPAGPKPIPSMPPWKPTGGLCGV